MKRTLLLTGIVTLLATSGCLVRDGGRHESFHEEGPRHFEHHETVILAHPAVVVRAPEVIVRPPEVIVR
jgi:hypothetical protein